MKRIPLQILVQIMLLALVFHGTALAELSVNGYSSVVIPDADNDPYHIGIELRRQAQELGLKVYLSPQEVPASESVRTCVAAWNWNPIGAFSGQLHVRIYDLLSRTMVTEADGKALNWASIRAAVERGVSKAWTKIGYTGFSEQQHLSNLQQLFPRRPIVEFDEKTFKAATPTTEIEGIWADPQGQYMVAITRAPGDRGFDYVGIILSSNNPLWGRGEIKMELRKTAVSTIYIGDYYPADKKRQGTTFVLEGRALLKFKLNLPDGKSEDALFVKSWPPSEEGAGGGSPTAGPGRTAMGTGFLVSVDGLVATNWHVVSGANQIEVAFPKKAKSFLAKVAIKDPANDLALLQIENYSPEDSGCKPLPYQLLKASKMKPGDKVSSVGYPLQDLLGGGAKYSEGVISALTGVKDDPTRLQISAAIQPGSSGSPLMDTEGNVVGVVVSTIDPAYLYERTESLPQNVNFAIKSDYLINLIEMLPDRPAEAVKKDTRVEEISKCVVEIRSGAIPDARRTGSEAHPDARPELNGIWNGQVSNFSRGVSAAIQVTIHFSDGKLTGEMLISRPLYGSGPLVGSVEGSALRGRSVGEGFTIDWEGEIFGSKITGKYTVVESSDRGTWWVVK